MHNTKSQNVLLFIYLGIVSCQVIKSRFHIKLILVLRIFRNSDKIENVMHHTNVYGRRSGRSD